MIFEITVCFSNRTDRVNMFKQSLIMSASLLTLSSALVTQAIAQDVIDEVVVTARKKAESLQDVPIAVSALGEAKLDELGVDVFTDYLVQMPGVSAGGSGPGQNTIYILMLDEIL